MIDISFVKPEQLNECADLLMRVYREEPWNDQWPSRELAARYLCELMDNPVFTGFVACQNGKIVGVCFGHKRTWWDGDEFFIDEFFIDHNRQRSGIGSTLMQYVQTWVKAKQFTWLTCMTKMNFPSERFYLKNGLARSDELIFMYQKINK